MVLETKISRFLDNPLHSFLIHSETLLKTYDIIVSHILADEVLQPLQLPLVFLRWRKHEQVVSQQLDASFIGLTFDWCVMDGICNHLYHSYFTVMSKNCLILFNLTEI